MSLIDRLDNIYVIDTNMFGLDHYCAAYLVEGKEIALIDTGMASQIEALRAGIKAHGFSINDISRIFVTHCEHSDHAGNVGTLIKENPEADVYIHLAGLEYLTKPEIERTRRQKTMPLAMVENAGIMVAVPPSRIHFLNDGDVFDLGNGEKLKIIFAPGHQPGGIVILEEKNMGLFINDLVGNCFPDADAQYPLNPLGSDNLKAIESLKKLNGLPLNYLYLGHYGICDTPKEVIAKAIHNMQQLIDTGIKCIDEGKPENIGSKVWEIVMPELEKLRLVRGEVVFQYATKQHIPFQIELYTKYCQERYKK